MHTEMSSSEILTIGILIILLCFYERKNPWKYIKKCNGNVHFIIMQLAVEK